MKAFITQRQAIAMLREKTGMSRELCTAKVKGLPTKLDGSRDKIARPHLQRLIAEMSAPPSLESLGLKPLRKKSNKRNEWPAVIS